MAAIEGASRRSGSVGDATHDLYRRYGRQIYAYCYQRLRSREEAEDAVQTTFMNAFRSLQRGVTAEYEQAWLFKIAQNVCIARRSSSVRRLTLEAPNDFEVLQEVVPARVEEEPLELIGIEEALERMPENQRRAILLREWQGLSYREICEELDLSQAAVEMLIFRARRTLAGALEQPGEDKKRRAGRKVGALGSALGALKTLLGGGAAIKAAAVAAAAIAVVGEGASHTIVRSHSDVGSATRVRATASQAVASAVSQSPSHTDAAGRDAGVTAAPTHAPHAVHTAAAATAVAPRTPRPAAIAEPATAPPAMTPPSPPVTTPQPAPASVPAPAPSPTQPATPESASNRQGKDKSKDEDPTPLPTPAPIEAPPTTTTTATTTTIATTATTTTTSTEPSAPAPLPAAVDPQPSHGNDGDHGHGKQKDLQPPPEQTLPIDPQAAPAAVTDNANGNGRALGKNK